MAKAIMEYNLNETEDIKAHLRAVKSLDMAITLWDIDQLLRHEVKYNGNEVAEKIREEIRQIMSIHNIDLDELMD